MNRLRLLLFNDLRDFWSIVYDFHHYFSEGCTPVSVVCIRHWTQVHQPNCPTNLFMFRNKFIKLSLLFIRMNLVLSSASLFNQLLDQPTINQLVVIPSNCSINVIPVMPIRVIDRNQIGLKFAVLISAYYKSHFIPITPINYSGRKWSVVLGGPSNKLKNFTEQQKLFRQPWSQNGCEAVEIFYKKQWNDFIL